MGYTDFALPFMIVFVHYLLTELISVLSVWMWLFDPVF